MKMPEILASGVDDSGSDVVEVEAATPIMYFFSLLFLMEKMIVANCEFAMQITILSNKLGLMKVTKMPLPNPIPLKKM
jgi:hypothetical protein